LQLIKHLEIIKNSYSELVGEALPLNESLNLIEAFDDCIYPIASHDNSPEPLFNYANKAALKLFKMSLHDMIGMPSKASALSVNQHERSLFLKEVSLKGFIKHYQGQRVASDHSTFHIQDATVWNLINQDKKFYGQAVIIFKVLF
jgi:hypothetical protein